MMKTRMRRLTADERGAALVLTLVLLLVASLIIPSLLGFMFGGLRQGEVHQRRAGELYAADAGVEEALWHIGTSSCRPTLIGPHDPIHVNGNDVTFSIAYGVDAEGVSYYKVLSTAHGDTSETTIEAYAVNVFGNYTDITNNVLTSQHGINYPPKPIVNFPEGNGPKEYYEGPWPKEKDLAEWYEGDVNGLPSYASNTLDLNGEDLTLGPLFRDGNLEITNTGKNIATLTLTGTLYVTGDLTVNPKDDLIIDLNNQAIFVQSGSTKPPKEALYIKGPKVTMRGPGVIAAMGDIYFEPNLEVGMTDPIFIISVDGTTTLKPGGDFYGAVAGSVEIDLQPGSSVTYPEEGFPDDLNWPGFSSTKYRYALASWTVSTS